MLSYSLSRQLTRIEIAITEIYILSSYKVKSNTKYFQMNVCILQMLFFDRTNVSQGINVNKTIASEECDIGIFLDKGFKFQRHICNGCHDVLMVSIYPNDIAVLKKNGVNIVVLLPKLAKVVLQIYYKIMI